MHQIREECRSLGSQKVTLRRQLIGLLVTQTEISIFRAWPTGREKAFRDVQELAGLRIPGLRSLWLRMVPRDEEATRTGLDGRQLRRAQATSLVGNYVQ